MKRLGAIAARSLTWGHETPTCASHLSSLWPLSPMAERIRKSMEYPACSDSQLDVEQDRLSLWPSWKAMSKTAGEDKSSVP